MYKIVGVDGKEYGPVSLETLKQWIRQGRVNARTNVQQEGSTDWKPAADHPELQECFQGSGPAEPARMATALPGRSGPPAQQGLAVTSLVLGILSLVCFGFLAGIPAIICGHMARGRAKRQPAQYGGAGFAMAGLVMGYVSVVLTLLIFPAMLLPALGKAKSRAQAINCVNNMKQIGLAFKVWALDHEDQYPFNVSTAKGGTFELCNRDSEGYEQNPAPHLAVMSNELSSVRILVCPQDSSKQAAASWENLQAANVSYRVRTGTNVSDINPQEILAMCPVHGHVLLSDGSVQQNYLKSKR